MKKTMKWLGALTLMMMCAYAFTACGGDDDSGGEVYDNGGNEQGQKAYSVQDLVGVWKLIHMVGYEKDERFDLYEADLTYEAKRRITINADGSFLEEDQKGDNINWRIRNNGTFRLTGDQLYVTYYYDGSPSKTSVMTIKGLTATQLILYEKTSKYEQTLTFQRVSDSGNNNGGTTVKKHYIYGEDSIAQPPFQPAAWDAAAMRFSNTDGAHFPTIPDNVYFGLKTLIINVSDASDDCDMKVMNGWWSNTYYDHVKVVSGLNEIKITETMAQECAQSGEGKDLDLMLYGGTCTIKSVYYEE